MDKIFLTEEKEPFLIPLLGKAQENKKQNLILIDKKTAEMVMKTEYDFSLLKISAKTNIMMCIRAKLIDNYVKRFFSDNNNSVALH